MQRIEDWLAQIGLERYAAAFANNDIDVAVLPHLTDADLEKIGVSLGHRRRILAAIAELRSAIPAPLQHSDSAERRQLTLMFCDLVGSTALATQLDPEDLREIIAGYRHGVAAIVRKYGGTISRYIGDGMLILFGHPSAHEDDAERAVRAALKIATSAHAPGAPPGLELRVRLGLATGLVIVGDLIGSEAAEVQAVLGETPNLAARLQALAEPDGVVIAEDTRRLIGGLFDYQDLGAVMLKGFTAPVRVWRVRAGGDLERGAHRTFGIILVRRRMAE